MTEMGIDTLVAVEEVAIPEGLEGLVTTTMRKAVTIDTDCARGRAIPDVFVDDTLDALILPFGKATMKDRYLSPGESYQDRFANCVRYYANDQAHAQRMYSYISRMWCMPATPILSNGGTMKGNLISCFVNDMMDNLDNIIDTWKENAHMGAKGGGIGTYIGVRSIGEPVARNGKTSGAISFIQVINALVGCISQGSNRRGAGAVYMDMSHPEIDAFLDMRREAGGDPDRKALNLHHGVSVSNAFMEAVIADGTWDLISPHTKKVIKTVSARELGIKLVTTRLETGEPYILFSDNIEKHVPEHHKRSGLIPKTSNLCSEILLPTGEDHHGEDRTAVCCLFQLNLEKWPEWSKDPNFIKDCMYFLDNVLQDFIDNGGEAFQKSRYSAMRERSVGLGVMGFHSFLQSMGVPLEGAMAKSWNLRMFKHIDRLTKEASREIAEERGACPDAAEHGIMERFSYKTAIAPTASVSIICNGVSAGIDAIPANVYTHKTLDGSFEVRNPRLEKLFEERGVNTDELWRDIMEKEGSVQHLDFLTEEEKFLFKTSFEIDQRWLVELNADRTPYINQGQSFNIALRPDCHKRDLWKIHEMAWRLGVKTMYYLRSISIQRVGAGEDVFETGAQEYKRIDYEECLACQ